MDISPQIRATKAKTNKCDYTKLTSVYTAKETINKVVRHPSRDRRPSSLGRGTLRSLWLLPVELGQQGALGLPLLLVSNLRVLIAVSI